MGSTGDSTSVFGEPEAPLLAEDEHEPDPDPDSGMLLEVSCHDGDWSFLGAVDGGMADLAAALSGVLGHALANTAAVVALSSDAEVRRLNATWRGHDKPTNVLSFPAPPGVPRHSERRFLGDVVLAEETVVREAVADGIPSAHHVTHLVVHGVLHLIGYNHETEAEAADMEALEVQVLTKLGIPNPYQ